MYFLLFSVLACLSTCHCLLEKDEKNENHCGLLKQLLESSPVSVTINGKGFHREVVTTVELSPDRLSGLRVLLVHRWPRGVYLDPYQLASLSDQSDWQILIDSAIDLEVPAHKASGFVSYVYPNPDGPAPALLKVTLPIHGRYHEPSFDGQTFISVDIEPPELLLRAEKCTEKCAIIRLRGSHSSRIQQLQPVTIKMNWTDQMQFYLGHFHIDSDFRNFTHAGAMLNTLKPHPVVNASCTPDNSSTCPWVKLQRQQENSPVSFQFPVGNGSLVTPVCGGTLLITMVCCVALSKYMWQHQID